MHTVAHRSSSSNLAYHVPMEVRGAWRVTLSITTMLFMSGGNL